MHNFGRSIDGDETVGSQGQASRALGLAQAEGPARYDVRDLLARGGMGDVHGCEDAWIGREVAIKLLRDPSAASVERFVSEARLQGRLEHPAIVPVYDLGRTDEGVPFFTMKRVRGLTLAAVISGLREGDAEITRRYSLRKLLTSFAQVCLAVHYAHRRGVVHRDLKPKNVMLGCFGEVHVLDWGLATLLDPEGCGEDAASSSEARAPRTVRLSQPGSIVGTAGYLAPEQARGQGACTQSDVYALGAMLFEILTLRPLHGGTTFAARLVSTMQGTETRPSRRAPELAIAPLLDDLVVRALAQDPAARPDARVLADEIERVLDEETHRMNARDRASQHAEAAQDAAARALRRPDDDSRAFALREAGKALALDPENAAAREALRELLVRPPEKAPPGVRAALEESERELARATVRTAAMRAAVGAALMAFAALLGVHDWGAAAIVIGATVAVAVTLAFVRARGAGPGARLTLMTLMCVGVASLGGLFGPFVLVPAFAATLASYFALAWGRTERMAAAVLGVSAILVPYALELVGVLPASLTITESAIVLHPRLVSFPPVATALVLVIGAALPVLVGVVATTDVRETLDGARRRLAVHAWQLERIIS